MMIKIYEQKTIDVTETRKIPETVYETKKEEKLTRKRWFRKDTTVTETKTVPKQVDKKVTITKKQQTLTPKLFNPNEAQEAIEQWFKFKSLKKAMLDGWDVHSSVRQIVNRSGKIKA